jgi:hypothetical protein
MNMKTAALIIGFILTTAVVGFGQARTITNFELEKYQQQRLTAEREYRENYKRLGFPSPEELDKQRDEDMKTRVALADQLRQARLEKERIELERQGMALDATRRDSDDEVYQSDGYYGGYVTGFGTYNSGRRYGRHRGRGFNRGGGYRVTPFEVIRVPTRPRPRPITVRGSVRRLHR